MELIDQRDGKSENRKSPRHGKSRDHRSRGLQVVIVRSWLRAVSVRRGGGGGSDATLTVYIKLLRKRTGVALSSQQLATRKCIPSCYCSAAILLLLYDNIQQLHTALSIILIFSRCST
ncbi:hypothetical protein J6590_016449 [Homalodisca vitripennis]|nr:hypothetical protein J6590_016449 [Homalodisca vitripennis]